MYGALGGNQNDASSDGTARQACKICPRAYANAGSLCQLWADKKAKQLDSLTNLSSPQVANGRLPTATLPRKQFSCPMCPKYISLYQHKRIKHPNAAFLGGAHRKGSSPVREHIKNKTRGPNHDLGDLDFFVVDPLSQTGRARKLKF